MILGVLRVLKRAFPGSTRSGEKARKKPFRDGLGGVHHHGEVGILRLAERRGDADHDRVTGRQPIELRARGEPAGFHTRREALARDVAHVGLAAVDGRDLLLREVEAGDVEARAGELHG
jgi:hypothetical protein